MAGGIWATWITEEVSYVVVEIYRASVKRQSHYKMKVDISALMGKLAFAFLMLAITSTYLRTSTFCLIIIGVNVTRGKASERILWVTVQLSFRIDVLLEK